MGEMQQRGSGEVQLQKSHLALWAACKRAALPELPRCHGSWPHLPAGTVGEHGARQAL